MVLCAKYCIVSFCCCLAGIASSLVAHAAHISLGFISVGQTRMNRHASKQKGHKRPGILVRSPFTVVAHGVAICCNATSLALFDKHTQQPTCPAEWLEINRQSAQGSIDALPFRSPAVLHQPLDNIISIPGSKSSYAVTFKPVLNQVGYAAPGIRAV